MSPHPHKVAHEAPPEALADDPSDFTREDYKVAFKSTLAEIKKDDVPSMAAGVAFKIFLAIFPAMIAAVAIFSIVIDPAGLERLLDQFSAVLPDAALELLEQPLQNLAEGGGGGAGLAAITGVLAGLWAATSAAATLIKALNRAYGVQESRKFFAQRGVALALTVALLVALIALVVLLVAGPQLSDALIPDQLDGSGIGFLAGVVRFLLAGAVLVFLFAFVYWLGPNRDQPRWMWISPGSVLAVIGWLVVAGGFTLYVQTAGNYEATYGAIAGVVVLMLWLQLSMLVLLVGAEFNAEIEALRARHAEVAAGAGFGLSGPAALSTLVPAEPAGAAHAAEAAGLTAPASPRARRRRYALPGLEETEGNGAGSKGPSGMAKVGAAAATAAAVVAVIARRRQ
jgi:membrane protein